MTKKILKKLYWLVKGFIKGIFWYAKDFFSFRRALSSLGETVNFRFFPKLLDKSAASHTFDKHYVYMDRWAFMLLLNRRPFEHVDVGSSIRFISMATTISKVKFVDIRPVDTDFENYQTIKGSILNMPFKDNEVLSLSCLHVAEHIGLGRYGDPIDPLGTVKACKELTRILAPNGRLYFALPVGKPAIYFNAHRVHDPEIILKYFSGLKLLSFAVVGDDGRYRLSQKPLDYKQDLYACGMYEFTKDL